MTTCIHPLKSIFKRLEKTCFLYSDYEFSFLKLFYLSIPLFVACSWNCHLWLLLKSKFLIGRSILLNSKNKLNWRIWNIHNEIMKWICTWNSICKSIIGKYYLQCFIKFWILIGNLCLSIYYHKIWLIFLHI